MIKKVASLCLAVSMSALVACGSDAAIQDESAVATVNNVPITQDDVDRVVAEKRAEAGGDEGWREYLNDSAMSEDDVADEAVDELVEAALIRQQAKTLGIDASDERLNEEVEVSIALVFGDCLANLPILAFNKDVEVFVAPVPGDSDKRSDIVFSSKCVEYGFDIELPHEADAIRDAFHLADNDVARRFDFEYARGSVQRVEEEHICDVFAKVETAFAKLQVPVVFECLSQFVLETQTGHVCVGRFVSAHDRAPFGTR